MALIDHTQLFNRFELLIWEIKNSDKIEAIDLPNNILKKIDSNKSQLKKNQILAVHQILKHRNIPSQDLFYDNYGAPYLTSGLNISISHSELFVAVCLSKEKVGIDLQIINEKIVKVSNKFINDLEKKLTEKNNLEKLTHLWTIKEAAYKYFTVGKLSLKNDIIVKQLGDDSNLQINGLGKHLNLKSKTIITPNYICSLVYDE